MPVDISYKLTRKHHSPAREHRCFAAEHSALGTMGCQYPQDDHKNTRIL